MNGNLSAEKMIAHLQTMTIGHRLICLESVDSTNSEIKRREQGDREGTIVFSEEQTAGKGRQGQVWLSPKGKGLWMSVLLKPHLSVEKIPQLNLVAAAAIALSLDNVDSCLDKKILVKWPNDLFLNGKKICGILTETHLRENTARLVILGIGLNVNLEEADFPLELKGIATSLLLETGHIYNREIIAASILNQFEELYLEYADKGNLGRTLEICRERSAVIGKDVLLCHQGMQKQAHVLDIGAAGELLVRLDDGREMAVVSGEISLKLA